MPGPLQPISMMIVAGDPSGDVLAAELVGALRECAGDRGLRLFGAGGPRMAAAGVELIEDMTRHAVIGLAEAVRHYPTFRRLFDRLVRAALHQRPDAIVCIDFAGFNRRFARAVRARSGRVQGWRPRIVQYVSPQVWASRPRRAQSMARDLDLLLCIFPFEPAWYREHAPELRAVFVGHPMIDRYAGLAGQVPSEAAGASASPPRIAILPGSRRAEVQRHLSVMVDAARRIRQTFEGASFHAVAANPAHLPILRDALASLPGARMQVGGLERVLLRSDLALASTGTVTMECAFFGVPAVAMYRTSWLTYQIGRRIVTVPFIAMPNLIAREEVMPEFVQDGATPANVAAAAVALLQDPERRAAVRARLAHVVASLGEPGANLRAARAILDGSACDTRPG